MNRADVLDMERRVEDMHGPLRKYVARRKGFVYFIQANGGPIKIGWSRNPLARLAELQTAHPYRLRLLQAVAAPPSLERELHDEFADERLAGEWYRDTAVLLARIAELSPEHVS